MRRPATRKGVDRRKKPRASKATRGTASHGPQPSPSGSAGSRRSASEASRRTSTQPRKRTREDSCENCGKGLAGSDRALFVEEEVGRIFCCEDCIAGYFAPEISRLEKEFFRRLSAGDLSADDREGLAHLRWITLQEADEIWREKTLNGDFRYTLISEFQPGARRVWCICICLFLRGEPSFLYLAFPTKNAAMVNYYRRGERVQWSRLGGKKGKRPAAGNIERAAARENLGGPAHHQQEDAEASEDAESSPELRHDRLAPAWTEDETFIAQMNQELNQERSPGDIGPEEFGLYQSCLEETLEQPDEVWSIRMGGGAAAAGEGTPPCIYHFIRHYPDENPGIWYIIIARETEDDEEQIEIMDAFPTRDPGLVERYRRGELEVGQVSSRPPAARVVH